jgi:UDP:flavonoid glycosyltransferase YjiC (YdhE family)
VYVTLGSSGPAEVLQNVLDGLAGLPLELIASTAGRVEALCVPANARVADMLPGDQACKAADLVICNGGSPGTYQALAHGKPVIGLATNMDQFLNMVAVEHAGCGRLLRSRSATADTVRRVTVAALHDRTLAARAATARHAGMSADACGMMANLVRTLCTRQ